LAIAEEEEPLKLSEVNMFECSPDPLECGGTGKCEGSTPELGWNYIADITVRNQGGMYTNEDLPYEHPPVDKECEGLTDGLTPAVGITGWTLLPTNDYKSTMNAVAKVGPLALAVAAGEWSSYESGVFTSSSTVVNHAVVLAGYGVDDATGEKYYLIRNSWGPEFGENGYIRVQRTDEDDQESRCGRDNDPLVGITCALDENGNKRENIPSEKVCANSAILYDTSYPVGVHRL
jgi:cathepsin L